jgi:hypothetical protein
MTLCLGFQVDSAVNKLLRMHSGTSAPICAVVAWISQLNFQVRTSWSAKAPSNGDVCRLTLHEAEHFDRRHATSTRTA